MVVKNQESQFQEGKARHLVASMTGTLLQSHSQVPMVVFSHRIAARSWEVVQLSIS
jgi:hypothetical protein